jgi:plasmid stabilization system protein ParE
VVVFTVDITDAALDELQAEILYHKVNTSEFFAAKMKISFMAQVDSILPNPYIYPECRFIPTQTQLYRNIVWGNYLIIYKIKKTEIIVLSLFHSKQSPRKIKRIRKRK